MSEGEGVGEGESEWRLMVGECRKGGITVAYGWCMVHCFGMTLIGELSCDCHVTVM